MKRILILIALCFFVIGCADDFKKSEESYGKLIFEDDFNGTEIDRKKWERCPEWDRQDLGGKWENDCSYVKDGNLVIECRMGKNNPESGAVRTRNKFKNNFGVYKIRFKAEKASGLWFAFWLMTDEVVSLEKQGKKNGAEDGAEIDIIELISNDGYATEEKYKKYLSSAVHWDGYDEDKHLSNSHQYYIDDDFYDKYHELTFYWEKDGYTLYLDDIEDPIWKAKASQYGGTCTTENYMKITAEFGTWGGKIEPEKLPAKFYVDWVKVYELP